MLDATFNAEMVFGLPGLVVEVCGFLTSGGKRALEATELVVRAETVAVVARFVADGYD